MDKLTVEDLSVKDKKVLVRVDFNVPLNPSGEISDATRIVESLPTIQYLLNHGASVILLSHIGRPKGIDSSCSLSVCAKKLETLLNKPVAFASDCIGPIAEKAAEALKPGQVLLLENLRFYPAEEKPEKDPSFAEKLAKLGDLYVNDAFGTAHRKHSSTSTITRFFPDTSACGYLMRKEIEYFSNLLSNPNRPFYAIIGGSKISSKIGVLSALLEKVDGIFIGGGMSYTLLKAQGMEIGDSIFEENSTETAKEFLKKCSQKKIPLWLPKDIVIADKFDNNAAKKVVTISEGIDKGWQGMDIGPLTIEEWKKSFANAKTFFWNGPVGVFEFPNFAKGTNSIAQILSASTATTVVGGGDSVAAINAIGLSSKFSHISTGGGASLEYLEYGHLPGVDALTDKKEN